MKSKFTFAGAAAAAMFVLAPTGAFAGGNTAGCTNGQLPCTPDYKLSYATPSTPIAGGNNVQIYQTTTGGATGTNGTNAPTSTYGMGAVGLSSQQFNTTTNANIGASTTFWAYCIDPQTGTNFTNTYAQMTLADFFAGGSNSYYTQEITRSGYSGLSTLTATVNIVSENLQELFNHAYVDSLTSNVKAAAFGIAAWEIIMQDGTTNAVGGQTYSTNSGRVRTSGQDATWGNTGVDAVEAQAKAYLTALGDTPNTIAAWQHVGGTMTGSGSTATWTGGYDLSATPNYTYTVYFDCLSPSFSQTFVMGQPNGSNSTVPVPGTLALAGLGLLGAARIRRARRAA